MERGFDLTIISIPDCPACEAEKLMYPKARIVNADELNSGAYKGDDRLDLMVALQMADGKVPVLVRA